MSGLEIAAFALAIAGGLQQAKGAAKYAMQSFAATAPCRNTIQTLGDQYHMLSQQNYGLAAQYQGKTCHFEPTNRDILEARIGQMTGCCIRAVATLKEMGKWQISRPAVVRFLFATSVEEKLKRLSDDAHRMMEIVDEVNGILALTTVVVAELEKTTDMVVEEGRLVREHVDRVSADQNKLLVARIVSAMDAHFYHMRKSDQRFVAFYDFEASASYPDVGRSAISTLFRRELRMEQRVREAFPDGVYSILLREDCSEQEVVRQVADIVKKSGGEYEGTLIEANQKVVAAIGRAVEWFHDRACLFQIRNLAGSSHAELIRQVKLLADCGKSSFMLTQEEHDKRKASSSVRVVEECHYNRNMVFRQKVFLLAGMMKGKIPRSRYRIQCELRTVYLRTAKVRERKGRSHYRT